MQPLMMVAADKEAAAQVNAQTAVTPELVNAALPVGAVEDSHATDPLAVNDQPHTARPDLMRPAAGWQQRCRLRSIPARPSRRRTP